MKLLEEPLRLPGSLGMLTEAKWAETKNERWGNIARIDQDGELASEFQREVTTRGCRHDKMK